MRERLAGYNPIHSTSTDISQPYEDAAAADMVRYVQEKKTVYNKDVKQKATAAPAA